MFFALLSCGNNQEKEFKSCGQYKLRPFPHPQAVIPIHVPVGWEAEVDVVKGDWLSVTVIDTTKLRENDLSHSMEYIQFPAPDGYRRSVQQVLQALENEHSFLILQRGLIRIERVALDYILGNDEYSSTLIIPYEIDGQLLTIVARTDRRNGPVINDFCFIGPLLEKLVQSHPDVQV
jgi:hypothetical protein